MKKRLSWKHLAMVLSLVALVSCGSDDDDDDGIQSEQAPQEEEIQSFSTRINNNLLIAGTRCEGGETTEDRNGSTVVCERDRWLVTLDNINTCTDDGACTEVAVLPFVARLDRVIRVTTPVETFWEIEPVSAITDAQEDIIDDYLVRFNTDSKEAKVIPE